MTDFASEAFVTGSLEVSWIHGAPGEPAIQIHLGVGDVGDEAPPPVGHALRRVGRVVAVKRRVLGAPGPG